MHSRIRLSTECQLRRINAAKGYPATTAYASSLISTQRAREENEDSPPPDESDNERSEVVELSPSPAPSLRAPQDARETMLVYLVLVFLNLSYAKLYVLF